MGVEHFLVDDEGKNVLHCHKWYDLEYERRDDITDEEIMAARGKYPWLPELVVRWRREACGGRRLRLVTDSGGDEPWMDHETCETLPGWTVYSAFDNEDGIARRGEREWPPEKHAETVTRIEEKRRLAALLPPLPVGASGFYVLEEGDDK